MSELFGAGSSKNLDKLDKSRHQEMRDTFEIMKIERRKYLQMKVVLHTLNQCLTGNSDLPEDLKHKIRSLLLAAEVDACMNLNTKHSEQKLLGLSNLTSTDLSYSEQEKLNQAVYNKFKSIGSSYAQNSANITQVSEDIDLFCLNIHDKALLDTRKKLNKIQETYMENLKLAYELLQNLLQLRFENVEDLVENKLDEFSVKSKMYNLRSEMMKEKAKVDIFNETSTSFIAYQKLHNDIYEQQKDCQKEINDLMTLKEKYKFVACKEYDEILKLYLQYKTSLERKKDLYKQLKNK